MPTPRDNAGRTIRTIQNFDNGVVDVGDTEKDLTVEYVYDSAGRLAAMVAKNAKGTSVELQTTAYLYESPINRSLQTNVIYPDSNDTPATVNVSLAQTGGLATATATAHGYSSGDWVLIQGQGASDARYNGWFQVTVLNSTQFTFEKF